MICKNGGKIILPAALSYYGKALQLDAGNAGAYMKSANVYAQQDGLKQCFLCLAGNAVLLLYKKTKEK